MSRLELIFNKMKIQLSKLKSVQKNEQIITEEDENELLWYTIVHHELGYITLRSRPMMQSY